MWRKLGSKLRRGVLPVLAVSLLLAGLTGCGGGGTTELVVDDEGGGPLPTAPEGAAGGSSTGDGDPFSGSVDANDLIRRIDELRNETDLCTMLTGQAMADIAAADINLAGLASNPSGFSALFAALDRLFGHMRTISPPELDAPLTTLQGVWGGLADIDIRASDAERQAAELLAGDPTQEANAALGDWVTANCTVG
ncbi:MAG: hypothetical protein KDB31_10040 [Microthrixaceae bacterium]|nr:hypothetical protein [Microthrixaceae bacterium]